MADITDFKSIAKDRIYNQFPPLKSGEVSHLYEIETIEYETKRIEEYDVVLWHRLLKSIYQEPLEIECELHLTNQLIENPETAIFRRSEEKSKWNVLNTTEENAMKIQLGKIIPLPMNWKYFFRLPSNGIIQIGTKNRHTILTLAHVVSGKVKNEDRKHAKQFVSLLLDEAKKARYQLFNPLKEFEKTNGLKLYYLYNVYRANYVSAEFMLNMAVTQEEYLRNESLKYDVRTNDLYDKEKMKYVDQFMLAVGMYFLSAITYLFMALEGFINIVFHSFLKKNLRDRDLNIEQRFDIEQKLKLMPALCYGFIQKNDDSTSDIYSKFLKLKKYRNSIFHSKVEDSLKSFTFIEDGFAYNCDVSKDTGQFLPSQKTMLSENDVIEVKGIIDEIIHLILNSMSDDARLLTDKYILMSLHIPFFILNDGSLSIGESYSEQNRNNLAQHNNQPDR